MSKLSERVAELESEVEDLRRKAWNGDKCMEHVKRIAELEAELAKRKELPPLPDDVRVIIDTLRQSHITHDQAVKGGWPWQQ